MGRVDWQYRRWQAWTAMWGFGIPLVFVPGTYLKLEGGALDKWSLLVTVPMGLAMWYLTASTLRSCARRRRAMRGAPDPPPAG